MQVFFGTVEKFAKIYDSSKKSNIYEGLIELDGIGETQVKSIESFFSNNMNLKITKDIISELEINNYIGQSGKGIFSNKKIMFTGGFKNMSRSEAKMIAENNGGKVLGSISKKLNLLIVGDSKPTKKKIDQAKQLNIKIILEKDWHKMLNS